MREPSPSQYQKESTQSYCLQTIYRKTNNRMIKDYIKTATITPHIQKVADHHTKYSPSTNSKSTTITLIVSATLTKTSQKIEKDLTLSRLVGKVRFVSTTDLRDGMVLDNIAISTLPYFTKYTIHNPDDKIIITATEKPTSPYRTSLTPPIGTKQEDGDTELFFYYTFANKDKPYTAMDAASFKINYTDGTSRETSIQTGIIQAVRNNITTMKGAILMPETTEKGPIILHLSSQDDWGSDNKSIKF